MKISRITKTLTRSPPPLLPSPPLSSSTSKKKRKRKEKEKESKEKNPFNITLKQ